MRHRKRVVHEEGLDDLVRAHRERDAAEERFRREVLFAHEAGSSLRAIGERIGMPHESVRAIVLEQRDLRTRAQEQIERPMYTLWLSDHRRESNAKKKLAAEWRLSVPESDS